MEAVGNRGGGGYSRVRKGFFQAFFQGGQYICLLVTAYNCLWGMVYVLFRETNFFLHFLCLIVVQQTALYCRVTTLTACMIHFTVDYTSIGVNLQPNGWYSGSLLPLAWPSWTFFFCCVSLLFCSTRVCVEFCFALFYSVSFSAFFLLSCYFLLLAVSRLFSSHDVSFCFSVLFYPRLQTIRSALSDNVNPADFSNPTAVRLGSALVPGIMMTPVSSVLGKSSPIRHSVWRCKDRLPVDVNSQTVRIFPDIESEMLMLGRVGRCTAGFAGSH